MSSCTPQDVFGSDPAHVKWQVVRGDTSSLRVEFLENDEVTPFDISDWTFRATAYDPVEDVLDPLAVTKGNGYVDVVAAAITTENWGNNFRTFVNELQFDIEATLVDGTKWTPVIGSIVVLGDVSRSSL